MKNLFYLNLFFVGFPILLCTMGILDETLIFWGLISTMLTGLFQLIVGFGMYFDDPKDKMLQWYVGLVLLFFGCWLLSAFIETKFLLTPFLFALPPALALFLTYIIYKKRNL